MPPKEDPKPDAPAEAPTDSTNDGDFEEYYKKYGYQYSSDTSVLSSYSSGSCCTSFSCCTCIGLFAVLSVLSVFSLLSVFSVMSVLSVNSVMSVGCVGGFMENCWAKKKVETSTAAPQSNAPKSAEATDGHDVMQEKQSGLPDCNKATNSGRGCEDNKKVKLSKKFVKTTFRAVPEQPYFLSGDVQSSTLFGDDKIRKDVYDFGGTTHHSEKGSPLGLFPGF